MAKQNKQVKNSGTPAQKAETSNIQEIKSTPAQSSSSPFDAVAALLKGKETYLLLAALLLCSYFVFHDFLTMEKVYLYKDIGSDSINFTYPWLVNVSEHIKNYGIATWSFSQGLGQNIFPLSLNDLFFNVLMVLGKDKIANGIGYAEVTKVILSGFIFYKYLQQLKLSNFTAGIFAFLYAFSGYIILGGCWSIFSTETMYAALILFGFERWLNNGKLLWFVIGIAGLGLLQPFLLFPHAIFLAAYIPVRYNDVHDGEWKKFPLFLIKTIGLATLGVAICSFQLFPDLLQYIESPRVGGEARLIDKLKLQPVFTPGEPILRFTTTFRAFGSNMLGTGNDFKGWQNYLEAPLFYCGLLSLVTFTQLFVTIKKSQRIAYGILAGIFLIPIFFPYFRYTFWAFTGDYFRTFSLIIILLLLIFSAKALDNIIKTGKLNLPVLGVTIAFLLFLLYSPAADFETFINQGARSSATMIIILYGAILFGLSRQGNIKALASISLVLLCFMEMTINSSNTINDRDILTTAEMAERTGYNDYTVDAVKYINDHDKSFFRVNKDYSSGPTIHTSFNDAKVQGYYSTPSYFSFNQKNYIKFLGSLNIIDPKDELQTRWAKGLVERPLLMSLTSGKYWLSKKPANQLLGFGYDSVGHFHDVYVYRNKYALPLGITYDQIIDESSFSKLSNGQKDLYLLKGCVAADKENDLLSSLKHFTLADTAAPTSIENYFAAAQSRKSDTLAITEFKESKISGSVTLAAPKLLFFSIPFDEGWHATINGKEAQLYNINCGLTGLKLNAGENKVTLSFEPRYMKKGAAVSIAGLSALLILLFINVSRKKKQPEQAS